MTARFDYIYMAAVFVAALAITPLINWDGRPPGLLGLVIGLYIAAAYSFGRWRGRSELMAALRAAADRAEADQ